MACPALVLFDGLLFVLCVAGVDVAVAFVAGVEEEEEEEGVDVEEGLRS